MVKHAQTVLKSVTYCSQMDFSTSIQPRQFTAQQAPAFQVRDTLHCSHFVTRKLMWIHFGEIWLDTTGSGHCVACTQLKCEWRDTLIVSTYGILYYQPTELCSRLVGPPAPYSNLSPDTANIDRGSSRFSSLLPVKCRDIISN